MFPKDMTQQRFAEQTIDTPGSSLAEKIVEGPVTQTQGKTQQGVNTHAQHVVNTAEVERPKIIKQTLQKPIMQEKINQVTRHVETPLLQIAKKIFEVPELQFSNKVVDIPVVAQRQITSRLLRFPSCNTLIRWSMSLLCWSHRFHRCVS